jgi:aryl-alcohol dehydrogenase-like predicted oxidoreductase
MVLIIYQISGTYGGCRFRLASGTPVGYSSWHMRIRTLGRSGLRVSELCLGTMTFGMPGWGCDEAESLRLVDRYLEAGGNFVDTADTYAGTVSEEICGKAVRGRRTDIVLATKCTMPVLRPAAAEAGCTPAQLAIAWQLAKPEVTSLILGARSQAQLDDTLAAAETSVPEEVLARLDGASAIPLEYPNAFIDTIQRWLGNR